MGAPELGSASSPGSWTQGAPRSELDAGSPLLGSWTQGAPRSELDSGSPLLVN